MNIEAQFKDKVILITGADSGLGRTFCERFVSLGARVAMAVRESALHETVEFVRENQWQVSAFPFVVDFSQDRSADELATEVFRKMGQIDVLINNAAVRLMKDFSNITWEDWNTSVEINLRFPFFLSQKVSSRMREANMKGAIVNVASQLGLVAARDYSVYSVTKAGLIGMTRSLAIELARHGISVNAVAPGPTNTIKAGLLRDEDDIIDFLHKMPIARRIEAREVADAVVYLASNPGGAVTGHILIVDGGWTAW